MAAGPVLVVDFGAQYAQLIARRVREANVYSELVPHSMPVDEMLAKDPQAIILSGGPASVFEPGAPRVDPKLFDAGVPVLGICYGCQLIAHHLGGKVVAANDATAREYGKTETFFDTSCKLFKGLPEKSVTWMSHGDYMEVVPEGFSLVAHSDACPNVAICDETRGFYGVQYHPEVNHTEFGTAMIRNFLYEVCGATGDWTMGDFMRKSIEDIRANYAGLYGVEELSERLGVSKSHLVRTFTAAIGVPPGKYLTTVRVEAAQRLLLHREYTLDVVASLCGFSGANYLCRVFKKETGQSPAQWRAMAGHAAQSGLSPEESLREQELYI